MVNMLEIRESPDQASLTPSVESGQAPLRICLLGTFHLLQEDQPLDVPLAGKSVTLLASLALHLETGVPREALLETLWPDQDPTLSTVSLNSLVYSLQRRLRDEAQCPPPVVYANRAYQLNRGAGVSTDIARFDALASRGNWLTVAGLDVDAAWHYTRALELYRGDLAAGSDVFAIIERERLRARYLAILAWLAERALRRGEDAAALDHGLRLLASDPCREDAHRIVMRARVRRGERAQALRQYRLCEQVLRDEFDAEPEALTTELFHRIRVNPASI